MSRTAAPRRAAAVLALTALLAACGGGGRNGYTSPNAGNGGRGKDGSQASLPPPSAKDLAADANRFKGLAARDVTAALGDPNYLRRENPAEVWQYYGHDCVLDLFLYDENGTKRVSFVDLRSRVVGQPANAQCLSDLLAGKRGQPVS
ncbi:MAG TPA: hypothetical protein VK558_12485 [Patescibacteria group bacterium]|nr:hypothetical protein [Patescibacteria group bacterium]